MDYEFPRAVEENTATEEISNSEGELLTKIDDSTDNKMTAPVQGQDVPSHSTEEVDKQSKSTGCENAESKTGTIANAVENGKGTSENGDIAEENGSEILPNSSEKSNGSVSEKD